MQPAIQGTAEEMNQCNSHACHHSVCHGGYKPTAPTAVAAETPPAAHPRCSRRLCILPGLTFPPTHLETLMYFDSG